MGYRPEPLTVAKDGNEVEALIRYLVSELRRVGEAFETETEFLHLATLNVAPSKPREGMVIKADGTNFDPGSGAGFYGYRAGSWRFLG